jgi:ribonucleoside-diphosphate reductase alpha chain
MDCPFCQPEEQKGSRVLDTRQKAGTSDLRRRRECLGPKKHRFTTLEAIADTDTLERGATPTWRRMPRERESITHKFSIAGHEGYITAGKYEDGTLGEVFVSDIGKDGSTMRGLLNAFATAISIGLQYGVPLEVFVREFSYLRFEPEGITGNPEIPFAKSMPDYIARWLASRFIDDTEMLEDLGILTPEVRAKREAEMGLLGLEGPMSGKTKGKRRNRA